MYTNLLYYIILSIHFIYYNMGMVKTQFVKYAKKSNKHLHRVRGKITHRRVKKAGLRKVFTMQKGGKRHVICQEEKSIFSKKGISIEYDDEYKLYYIGKKPYKDLISNTRYENALKALKAIGFIPSLEENIVLNQDQYTRFAQNYAPDVYSESIRRFNPGTLPAAAAAEEEEEEEEVPPLEPTINTLQINKKNIAFTNHLGESQPQVVNIRNTIYRFDNVTIPLGDSVVKCTLTVKFNEPSKLQYNLSINHKASECMMREFPKALEDCKVKQTGSTVVVTGEIDEQRHFTKKISSYNFDRLITTFVEVYEYCMRESEPISDDAMKLEIQARFNVINRRYEGMSQFYKDQWNNLRKRVASIGDSTSSADLLKLKNDMEQFSDLERESRQRKGGKTMRKNRIRIHR
jgi:hypothetical protein